MSNTCTTRQADGCMPKTARAQLHCHPVLQTIQSSKNKHGYHSTCCSPGGSTGAGGGLITMLSLICLAGLSRHTLTQFDPQESQMHATQGLFPLLMPNDRVFSFLFSPSLAKAQTVLLISCGWQSLARSFMASATAASKRPEGSSSRVAIAHRLLARCCLLNLMASSGMPSLAVTSTSTACISACTTAASAATHCCDEPLCTAKAQHLCMLCFAPCLLRLTASLSVPKLA